MEASITRPPTDEEYTYFLDESTDLYRLKVGAQPWESEILAPDGDWMSVPAMGPEISEEVAQQRADEWVGREGVDLRAPGIGPPPPIEGQEQAEEPLPEPPTSEESPQRDKDQTYEPKQRPYG